MVMSDEEYEMSSCEPASVERLRWRRAAMRTLWVMPAYPGFFVLAWTLTGSQRKDRWEPSWLDIVAVIPWFSCGIVVKLKDERDRGRRSNPVLRTVPSIVMNAWMVLEWTASGLTIDGVQSR
jgi:hypothetical protein